MGSLRSWDASSANADDRAQLPQLTSTQNTTSGLGAKAAYCSKKNEAFLERGMFKSNIHQKRMPRQPLPCAYRPGQCQTLCCSLGGCAHLRPPEAPHGPVHPTPSASIRARITIGMASLADNVQRLAWLEGKSAPA
jgi:hypothetical protein